MIIVLKKMAYLKKGKERLKTRPKSTLMARERNKKYIVAMRD
jgi:hypothetical protein